LTLFDPSRPRCLLSDLAAPFLAELRGAGLSALQPAEPAQLHGGGILSGGVLDLLGRSFVRRQVHDSLCSLVNVSRVLLKFLHAIIMLDRLGIVQMNVKHKVHDSLCSLVNVSRVLLKFLHAIIMLDRLGIVQMNVKHKLSSGGAKLRHYPLPTILALFSRWAPPVGLAYFGF
jgi:hypothetical protein